MKTFFTLLLIFIGTYAPAQLYFTDSTLLQVYDHNTIHLQSDGYVKNGDYIKESSLFKKLGKEIADKGSFESIDQFKKFKAKSRLANILAWSSIFTALLALIVLVTEGVTTSFTLPLILFFLTLLGVSILRKKAFDYLNRAVWFYNRYILLKGR